MTNQLNTLEALVYVDLVDFSVFVVGVPCTPISGCESASRGLQRGILVQF